MVASISNDDNGRALCQVIILVAKVSQPEVGLVKGGSVTNHHRTGGSANHLNGSFRTWLQMAKTISVPAMGKNESLDVVASLVPAEGGFPGAAASLNDWLDGAPLRLTKPKAKITDNEVKRKLVIAGVNYDPSLAFPEAGCNVEAGFRFCTVKDGKVGSQRGISGASSSVGRFEKKVVLADATPDKLSSGRIRVWEAYRSAVSLKFRLEAFYDFSIETSGLDDTPFAIYALGRLDNAYLECRPGPTYSQYPPVSVEMKVKSSTARLFAFDYDGAGRLDNIVCDDGAVRCYGREIDQPSRFSLRSNFDSNYCLAFTGGIKATPDNPTDRAFAFDYAGSGKLDHLVFYRPGGRMVSIYKKNKDGNFESVYESTTGICRYDLASPADRAFAFDYDGSGKLDLADFFRALQAPVQKTGASALRPASFPQNLRQGIPVQFCSQPK